MKQQLYGLGALWLLLAVIAVWRIAAAQRWGFALAIALIAWLGGVVAVLFVQAAIKYYYRTDLT